MTAPDPLPEPYVWRAVNKRDWPSAGQHRHILPKQGAHTSLCSTTALPASVWRAPRGQKPDCPDCVAKLPVLVSAPEPDDEFAWALIIEAWRTAYGVSFAAAERAIRADEQAKRALLDWTHGSIEAGARERLRAKILHLPVPLSLHNADCPGRDGYRGICDCAGEQLVRKRDVLAALDGESDD